MGSLSSSARASCTVMAGSTCAPTFLELLLNVGEDERLVLDQQYDVIVQPFGRHAASDWRAALGRCAADHAPRDAPGQLAPSPTAYSPVQLLRRAAVGGIGRLGDGTARGARQLLRLLGIARRRIAPWRAWIRWGWHGRRIALRRVRRRHVRIWIGRRDRHRRVGNWGVWLHGERNAMRTRSFRRGRGVGPGGSNTSCPATASGWRRRRRGRDPWRPSARCVGSRGGGSAPSGCHALDDKPARLLIQLELEIAARLRFLEQLVERGEPVK